MSDTAQQTAGKTGAPQRGQAGAGGGLGSTLMRFLRMLGRQREATVFVIALALFLYFLIVKGSDFTSKPNQVTLWSDQVAPYAIIALGEVFLLICGEIDLSVGFVVGFAPYLMHYLIDFYGFPGLLAMFFALLLGLVVGWVNGFFTVTLGLPSFITTLGTGFILLGLMNTTSHDQPAAIPAAVMGIGKWITYYAWAPIVWAVVLTAIFHVVLNWTRWGLHTIATGGNQLGAKESGVNVARIKYGNFMLCATLGAFTGLMVAFQLNTIDPSAGGFNAMFYAVTAAVIGGTAMLGGSGTILGAFLGSLVLALLLDGFNLLGISANVINMIFGAAVLAAMVANVQLARLRGAGRVS